MVTELQTDMNSQQMGRITPAVTCTYLYSIQGTLSYLQGVPKVFLTPLFTCFPLYHIWA